MLLALVDGRHAEATPDGPRRGVCPHCEEQVVAKTGDVIAWHWAHKSVANCDPWAENETEWHLDWKRRAMMFGAQVEVSIRDEFDGTLHRADIVLADGTIVEIQRQKLSERDLADREAFYEIHGGLRWVFHAEALGWWNDDMRVRENGAYGFAVEPWLLRHFGGSLAGVYGRFANEMRSMLGAVRAPMAWDLVEHLRLGWAERPIHVWRWSETVVRFREATIEEVFRNRGPALRRRDNRVAFVGRSADETRAQSLPVSLRTNEGAEHRANDAAILFSIPCPECGSPPLANCRALSVCSARKAEAEALLARLRQEERTGLRIVA